MESVNEPLDLLGGLTAAQFMSRHWQKKPLLVRGAIRDPAIFRIGRTRLFELAQSAEVESRLITCFDGGWTMRHGPLPRRAVPASRRPGWTLLVQGVDRHVEAMHRALLAHFDFLPAARLDDLMVSYASDQGGVGPHVDQYDVFLLQAQGRRRWRFGPTDDQARAHLPDLPLKILAHFDPQHSHVLDPGDMLYLPPGWAHEGVAVGGDCITCSIGFRAPAQQELAADLLARLADRVAERAQEGVEGLRFGDPDQGAVRAVAEIPAALARFAQQAVLAALTEEGATARLLGELLSEPHPSVWFDAHEPLPADFTPTTPLRLDRRSRMLYDEHFIYLNGESRAAGGPEARVLRRLADRRQLDTDDLSHCSAALHSCLCGWMAAGWLHAVDATDAAPQTP